MKECDRIQHKIHIHLQHKQERQHQHQPHIFLKEDEINLREEKECTPLYARVDGRKFVPFSIFYKFKR